MGYERIKVGDTVYSEGNKFDSGSRVIEIERAPTGTVLHVVPLWYSGDEEWRYKSLVPVTLYTKEKPR